MRPRQLSRRELVEHIERQARAMRREAAVRCATAIVAALRHCAASIASRGASHDFALRRRC
jgi:hypothetical protein